MLPSPVCPPARPLLPCLARTTILLTLRMISILIESVFGKEAGRSGFRATTKAETFTYRRGTGEHETEIVEMMSKTKIMLVKTAEAEPLYQEVIAGYTEKLGADHTSTLTAKGNLANLLKNQGKTAEAEAYEYKSI